MQSSSLSRWLMMAFCGLALLGCSNEKRIAKGKPLRNLNPNQVLESYAAAAVDWNWLGMKIDASVETKAGVDSFKATIRIAKDSVIWVSLSPALGVEVARLMLEPDSVQLISKIPGNRFYFAGDYEALSDWADTPLRFLDIQDILTGSPMGLNEIEDKFNVHIDQNAYALISKYKRRVKRLIGINDHAMGPNDSLNIQAPDRLYARVKKRTDDDDLLIKRHWFDGLTFDPLKDQFDDLYYQRSLIITRSEFEALEVGRWPQDIHLNVETPDGSLDMTWDVKRMRFDRAYDFPFEIPEDYDRRTGF